MLRSILLCFAGVGVSACAVLDPNRSDLENLSSQIDVLRTKLDTTETDLRGVAESQQMTLANLGKQNRAVARIAQTVSELPESVASACSSQARRASDCDDRQPQRVVTPENVLLLGEIEHVWIEPPGVSMEARIDTGAGSNSISAEQMVEFERDGNKWVRFQVSNPPGETIQIERPIERYIRVYQQADPDGTRRPVVKLRVRLGNIRDSFEFTLADRSHLDKQVLLGRNFLTDVAVVDVGRRFVQPSYVPAERATASAANPEAL